MGVACTSLWGGRGLDTGVSAGLLALPCLEVDEMGVVTGVGVACEEGVAPLLPLWGLLPVVLVLRLSRSSSLCNRYLWVWQVGHVTVM